MKSTPILLTTMLLAMTSTSAWSQTGDKLKVSEASKTLDLSVPESPAFVILGISPETVARPTSIRELSATVKDGFDPSKNFALEVSLGNFFKNTRTMTLKDYRDNGSARLLRNTQLSMGRYRDENATDKSSQIAFGLTSLVINGADQAMSTEYDAIFKQISRADLRDNFISEANLEFLDALIELKRELARMPDQRAAIEVKIQNLNYSLSGSYPDLSLTAEQVNKLIEIAKSWKNFDTASGDPALNLLDIRQDENQKFEARKKSFPERIKAAYKKNAGALESKPMLRISAAPCYIDPSGTSNKYQWNGYGAWVSYSFGKASALPADGDFDKVSSRQIIVHARIRQGERAVNGETTGTKDTSLLGLRYRTGGPDLKFSLEVAEAQTRQVGQKTRKDHIIGVVFEPRIAQGVWSSISLGKDTRNGGTVGLKTSFRYGFN